MYNLLLFLVISLSSEIGNHQVNTSILQVEAGNDKVGFFPAASLEKLGDKNIQELSREEVSSERFDSSNVRFVGNWPFGPSYAVEVDSTRELVFCGSGGGVYIPFYG